MEYPYLQPFQTKTATISQFGGYHHSPGAKPGEWFDMENLSAKQFPMAGVRNKRGMVPGDPFSFGGQLIAKDCLWSVQGNDLVGQNPVKGESLRVFSGVFSSSPNLVPFSSYLVDIRGGQWFSVGEDTAQSPSFGRFVYRYEGAGTAFSVYLCDELGEPFSLNCFGISPPEECVGGMLWLDTTHSPGVLKRYYEDSASFVPIPTYLRISMDVALPDMQVGDMVELTFPQAVDEQGTTYGIYDPQTPKKVTLMGENQNKTPYFVVEGALIGCAGYHLFEGAVTVEQDLSLTGGITLKGAACVVENAVPLLDFAVACGNRIWGCRYGYNRKGAFVNEIYASALGSFRVWEKFEGIASDSYALSCGTPGPFTGAAVYGGNPLFFKENALHRVYGSFPFSVTPVICNGVMKGSQGSLAVVNNLLFYQSPAGLCTYTGNLPTLLHLPFGEKRYANGVGAGNQTHYYLSTVDEQGEWVLFVYDTVQGILTKEDGIQAKYMASLGEEVYATVPLEEGYGILLVSGAKGAVPETEETVSFCATTGMLGQDPLGNGYMHGLELCVTLPMGSTLQVGVQYNGKGEFYPMASLNGNHSGHLRLPLRLRPCRHFALQLKGQGEFTLHSLTHLTRKGGKGKCT